MLFRISSTTSLLLLPVGALVVVGAGVVVAGATVETATRGAEQVSVLQLAAAWMTLADAVDPVTSEKKIYQSVWCVNNYVL